MHLEKRIEKICKDLKELSQIKRIPVKNIEYKSGHFFSSEEADKNRTPWKFFDSSNMHWYGPDQHYWFRTKVVIPSELDSRSIWIHVRTQIDEWNDAKNPQFLAFINGNPVQGLDMHHQYLLIDEKAKQGEEFLLDFQAYSGNLHEELKFCVDIVEINQDIETLYYDIKIPLLSLNEISEDQVIKHRILEKLNKTINILDFRDPKSLEFHTSVKNAKKYIKQNIYNSIGEEKQIIASCIGHSHIDVAWWWTTEQTKEKVARSFATVLKLMDMYPKYKFMASQPQLYIFLKERYPNLFSRIKERVKEGRWETEGSMWVEADCNLTSGESLIRQIVMGKTFFKDEFDVENKILWLPDVFGYPASLPQIMNKTGIKYFMTTKLSWNETNQIPNDTFYWIGIDGSAVLSHIITTSEPGQSKNSFYTTYNGILEPETLIGSWKRYQNKAINNDLLVAYGYGDGGGGPTKEMLETAIRLESGMCGVPKVRQIFSGQYFEELANRLIQVEHVPEWYGELYLEQHRGTYTSIAKNKKENRKCEFLLMDTEFYSVLSNQNNQKKINRIWQKVLINQFHDILPGTSIEEVYIQTDKDYNNISSQLNKIINQCIEKILIEDNQYLTVFNSTGFERNECIVIKGIDNAYLIDEKGKKILSQKLESGIRVNLSKIPAKGYKTFKLNTLDNYKEEKKCSFIIEDKKITTPYYDIRFNTHGQIQSFIDKQYKRELVLEGKAVNVFKLYEDKPWKYSNWNIDEYYSEKFYEVQNLCSFKWFDIGELSASLQLIYKFGRSKIIQNITFYAKHKRIDFETQVEYKEEEHLLKVHFPLDISTDTARFDIQFGDVERKTHNNTSWNKAQFEMCGHKWVDVSEGNYGVSVLNDCKYGYSVNKTDIGMTLIKSGISPNPNSDKETHFFKYAIYPHCYSWNESDVIKEAYFFNQPMLVKKGRTKEREFSFVSSNKENIVIETVKEAENGQGIIIRMFESKNSRTEVKLRIGDFQIVNVQICDMLENVHENIVCNAKEFSLIMYPYEIKTVKIITGQEKVIRSNSY